MRIHCIRHMDHDTEHSIREWATSRGHTVRHSTVVTGDPLPHIDDFDLLISLGGHISANDDHLHWLAPEIRLLQDAAEADKMILGFCLGGQLLSRAFGGRVHRCHEPETGWHEVGLTPEGSTHPLFAHMEDFFIPFQWHNEYFTIPDNGTRLAFSQACANQGFAMSDKVAGLQFHSEYTRAILPDLLNLYGVQQRIGKAFIQPKEHIFSNFHHLDNLPSLLGRLLDGLTSHTD